jgi:hypothetical protein
VAQHGAVSAREHGSPASSDHPDASVPDRVNPAMKEMQPSGADTPVDRRGAKPEFDELHTRDHATLALGDRGDLAVHDDLTSHTDVKSSHSRASPPSDQQRLH